MSDDLVKRLLYWPAITKQNDIMKEAADRIEALEAQLAEAHALFDKINRTDARGPRNLTEARWIARDGLTKTKKAALETKGTRGE